MEASTTRISKSEEEDIDAPPVYTASPAIHDGEATIEVGPRRPFQLAQPAPWAGAMGSSHSSTTTSINQSQASGHGRYMSDFARDFYSSNIADSSQNLPIRIPSSTHNVNFDSSSALSDQHIYSPRPTTTPTPGHVLLNKGKTLFYPVGYNCQYCRNTGYRNFDPLHPCRKCWDSYSQTYNATAPSALNFSSTLPSRHQKPLPMFHPPHRTVSPCTLSTQNPDNVSFHTSSMAQFSRSERPSSLLTANQSTPEIKLVAKAPSGALVVQPGDPRIGGRICWRCDGVGTISFLIFDREQCPVCRGIGRLL